ncbi:MAG: class I SAM-dependent methyltransferase [Cyanobacteriota bacterium]|nr:class I SAM-dependent methyltransferase [Cyanobacteriota bacterium]
MGINLVLRLAALAEEDVLEASTLQPAKLSALIGPYTEPSHIRGCRGNGQDHIITSKTMTSEDRSSAWRNLEDQQWMQLQRTLDWMSAPGMHVHVNSFFPEGQTWFNYANLRVLQPLKNLCESKEQRGIRMLSLGCGSGSVDAACLEQGWPIAEYHLAEFDDHLLEVATERLQKQGLVEKVVPHRFDFDSLSGIDFGQFDVIFFCHSLHHCSNIEGLLVFLKRSLNKHGMLLGVDYFGGARLQPDFQILPLLRRLYALLPEHIKVNLVTGLEEPTFCPQSMEDVMIHDPSEAPRSGDLRSIFLSQLKELNTVPMGGTILRPLLTHRAGHFISEDPNLQSLLKLFCLFEFEMINNGRIQSDDMLFFGKL